MLKDLSSLVLLDHLDKKLTLEWLNLRDNGAADEYRSGFLDSTLQKERKKKKKLNKASFTLLHSNLGQKRSSSL